MSANRSFLVVEKDQELRYLYKRALNGAFPGCEVVESESCAHALEVLSGRPADAVVVNQEASDARGTVVIAAIRERFPALPIVSIGEAPLERKSRAAGATEFVPAGEWNEIGDRLGRLLGPASGGSARRPE